MNKWLIFGHYGGYNTGDEAMLAGLLIGSQGLNNHYSVVTKTCGLPSSIQTNEFKPIPVKISRIIKELMSTKGLILGGGTHFHDDYSFFRYIRHLAYMSRIVFLSAIVKALKKKVIWLSMGFGPFFLWPTRFVTQLGLRLCDFVTVRDMTSWQEIENWIPNNKVRLGFDLAALITQHAGYTVVRETTPDNNFLGLSITSVKKSRTGGLVVDLNFWKQFSFALRNILNDNPNLNLRIFIFRGGKREDDYNHSIRIYQDLHHEYPDRIEFIDYNPDPIQTYRKMAECNAFIATRYHSALMAYMARCNLLLIVYHRKLEDFSKEVGLQPQACLKPDEVVSHHIIQTRIQELISDPSKFIPTLPLEDAVERAKINISIIRKFEHN